MWFLNSHNQACLYLISKSGNQEAVRLILDQGGGLSLFEVPDRNVLWLINLPDGQVSGYSQHPHRRE